MYEVPVFKGKRAETKNSVSQQIFHSSTPFIAITDFSFKVERKVYIQETVNMCVEAASMWGLDLWCSKHFGRFHKWLEDKTIPMDQGNNLVEIMIVSHYSDLVLMSLNSG